MLHVPLLARWVCGISSCEKNWWVKCIKYHNRPNYRTCPTSTCCTHLLFPRVDDLPNPRAFYVKHISASWQKCLSTPACQLFINAIQMKFITFVYISPLLNSVIVKIQHFKVKKKLLQFVFLVSEIAVIIAFIEIWQQF